MSLVSPARFNELRFAHDPQPMVKLWRWCREGKLPARKIGGEWFVDLEAFDRGEKAPVKQEDIPRGGESPGIPSKVVELLAARARR